MEDTVADTVNKSVEHSGHLWELFAGIDVIQVMTIGFMIIFATLFLVMVFYKGLTTVNIGETFIDETGKTSHTRLWGSIAYFAATVSFLAINLLHFKDFHNEMEMIWMIYLSVVAGNNIASKWISAKYPKAPPPEG